MRQGKVLSVVIGVALDTGRSGRPCLRKSGMKPPVMLQLVSDLAMTFETAKGGRLF